MGPILDTTLTIRRSYQRFLKHLSLEELNFIPSGFNNNIFWNIGHVISVQQMIVVGLAGQRWRVDKEVVKTFKKGSKPERIYTEEDRNTIDSLLIDSILWTHEDMEKGLFKEYTPYETITGFLINDYSSACAFNLFHEGLHMGYLMAIKKMLK